MYRIYDNTTYQSLTINENFDPGITLVIDCDNRTIIGDDGNDYSTNITLNSFWLCVNPQNDFDLSNSTGCMVQTVQFQEGC